MPLTGPQMEQVANAITGAYTRVELKRVVRVCMGEDFDALVSDGPFEQQVFELVEWASRKERDTELIACVHRRSPQNKHLEALYLDICQPSEVAQLAEQLINAIAASCTRSDLKVIVRTDMGEDFNALAPDGAYLLQVKAFVDWAMRQNRVEELLECLYHHNPNNGDVNHLYRTISKKSDHVPQPPIAPQPQTINPRISPAHHIFLAYSRKDAEIMRRLRADLLAAGIAVWVDDEDLEPGTPLWQRAIQRAIRDAECMIVIMSPDACESEWVNSEITYAKRRNLRIIPVLGRGDEDDAVPLALTSVQYVDVRGNYEQEVRKKLISALRKRLSIDDKEHYARQPAVISEVRGNEVAHGSSSEQALWLDEAAGVVWVDGRCVNDLSPLQFQLLRFLFSQIGQVCTREQIISELYPEENHPFGIDHSYDQRSDSLIHRLRRVIEPNPERPQYLLTVPGIGYKLVDRPE